MDGSGGEILEIHTLCFSSEISCCKYSREFDERVGSWAPQGQRYRKVGKDADLDLHSLRLESGGNTTVQTLPPMPLHISAGRFSLLFGAT